MISLTVRPNFDRKPPDDCRSAAARGRAYAHADLRPHAGFSRLENQRSSSFSTTGMMLRPILCASIGFDELGVR
jgi:hypothetical protein